METNEKVSETLNDLLKINNDRVEGYEKAADQTKDRDLEMLFQDMADESRKIASSLTDEIEKLGEEAELGSTTASGKIYRVWMDVKATFTGKDSEAILNACEYGEDAAQSAYKAALEDDDIHGELRQMIEEQKANLRSSHNLIKEKRDELKVA